MAPSATRAPAAAAPKPCPPPSARARARALQGNWKDRLSASLQQRPTQRW